MARKELAGLAALGALAMMANRSKKGADRDTDTGVDVQPSYATRDPLEAANSSQDAMDIRDSLTRGAPGTSETIKPTVTSPRMKTPAVRKPMTGSGSGGGRGPAAGEAEAYRQKQYDEANARAKTPEGRAERERMESSQALEAVRPEEAMIGGGGLKTVAAMARGLANRKGAAKLAEYSTPQIGMSRPMLPRPGQTYGEGFVMNRKNGGAIKMAKGGMARSSASSRGDGIASRGKTKGRMR
jgi:hypothetical protein